MPHKSLFYIGGEWRRPLGDEGIDLICPATHQAIGIVTTGVESEVDQAVRAAREAAMGANTEGSEWMNSQN